MNVIEAKNLSYRYENKYPALDEIHFTVSEGETVGIIGANGAGKSTLLKLIVGLLTDYRGELLVGGNPVEKKRLKEIREKIGYVFQDSESQLFLSTVYEDVAFGPRNYGYSPDQVNRRVMDALRRVGMEKWKDSQIYRLSGGQKKLAAIATVLSMEPEVILLDEPSVALDPRNRRKLMTVLNTMQCTRIIASHDMDFIRRTCSRVLLLAEGRLRADGKPEEILDDQKLMEKNGL